MTKDGEEVAGRSDSLSYEHRIVAFLDILGFRGFVSQEYSEATRTIKAIDDALEHTLRNIREQDDPGWVSVKTFSDCLCLSTHEDYLSTLIDAIAFLQYYLATSDIFVRGGLSAGYHCETSRMIFSEGLVRAYEIQNQDPYPRVLVDPEVVRKVLPAQYSSPCGGGGSLTEYILMDGSDVCFLDYLQAIVVEGSCMGNTEESLEQHAQAVRKQLALHAADSAVYRKHWWLANYHNFRVREVFDESEWEADYAHALMRKLRVDLTESHDVDIDAKNVCFTRPRPSAA